MKIAMVHTDRALAASALRTRLVLQIHDELLLEGPAAEAEQVREIVARAMEGAYELDPPLAVESGVGRDWLSAK
jgi:DNA polymerase-1